MKKFIFDGVSLMNGRPSNMDSLLIKQSNVGGCEALLSVVCDGVGSLCDGGFAAAMSARLLGEWFGSESTSLRIGMKMRNKILDINALVMAESARNNKNTASTLSALLLIEDKYYITHIGDSRVYSFCNKYNELSLITSDDVTSDGRLSASIGRITGIIPQYYEGNATKKTFLLCSDGLANRMDDSYLSEKLQARISTEKDCKAILSSLSQHVIDHGEKDNISIALVRNVMI